MDTPGTPGWEYPAAPCLAPWTLILCHWFRQPRHPCTGHSLFATRRCCGLLRGGRFGLFGACPVTLFSDGSVRLELGHVLRAAKVGHVSHRAALRYPPGRARVVAVGVCRFAAKVAGPFPVIGDPALPVYHALAHIVFVLLSTLHVRREGRAPPDPCLILMIAQRREICFPGRRWHAPCNETERQLARIYRENSTFSAGNGTDDILLRRLLYGKISPHTEAHPTSGPLQSHNSTITLPSKASQRHLPGTWPRQSHGLIMEIL